MKNLLYISCHASLERNDLIIFNNLGFNVMSIGFYVDPKNPSFQYALPLNYTVDKELYDHFKLLNPNYEYGYKIPLKLDKDFLDRFDIVIVTWRYDYLKQNWDLLKDKLVLFQTVGQSEGNREREIAKIRSRGVKVIRMSESEKNFPGYGGTDEVIDLSIDTSIFKDWVGDDLSVLTINKMMWRKRECNTNLYLQVTNNFPRKLYGTGNDSFKCEGNLGPISSDDLIEAYARSRVCFSIGTKPGPVTMTFKEAMSAGCPVITWGPKLGSFSCTKTYTAYKYLENGMNGYYSDDIEELRSYIDLLFNDYDLAKQISIQARKTALKHFSIEVIQKKWENLFNDLGLITKSV